MNKKKFICFLIYCLIVFPITLKAAFTVKSRVEINFILQTDIQGSLDELWLIERSGLFYKADIVNKQQICFADVKPGIYGLQLAKNGENSGSAVYEKKIMYDPNLEKITSYIRCMNEVIVKSNKNLIIKITIKKSDMESHFGDIQERIDQFCNEVDLIYYLQPTVPQSYKTSKNGSSTQSLMDAAAQDRSQTISIDKLCEFDNGNISVKIDQAHIVDLGITENAPTGTDGMGDKEGDKYVLGKVRIVSNKAKKKEAQSICDEQKKKCVSHFVFDVEVQLKTVLWNKDDMCAAVGARLETCSGIEKKFKLSEPFNCSCEYDAVKVHEEKHFQLWIEAMNKLKAAECNDIFQYTVATDCTDECTDCNIDEIKVSSAIENKLNEIYSQANGDLQEDACELEEQNRFKACVRCR